MNKDITQVECLGGTRLRLTFEDDVRRDVDIAGLVRFDGVFEPLKDPGYFKLVKVNSELGTIVWPNGADLCSDSLYSIVESNN